MDDPAFVSPPLAIKPEFLDHNGHVNMAYHLVLADEALDLRFQQLKGADYVEGRGMTTFAAEVHVRYLREMTIRDDIRGRVFWVESDAKRTRWAVELFRASDGVVVTTVEGVSMSVSVETRKVTPYPEDVSSRLEAAVSGDGRSVNELDWLGRSVAMKKG